MVNTTLTIWAITKQTSSPRPFTSAQVWGLQQVHLTGILSPIVSIVWAEGFPLSTLCLKTSSQSTRNLRAYMAMKALALLIESFYNILVRYARIITLRCRGLTLTLIRYHCPRLMAISNRSTRKSKRRALITQSLQRGISHPLIHRYMQHPLIRISFSLRSKILKKNLIPKYWSRFSWLIRRSKDTRKWTETHKISTRLAPFQRMPTISYPQICLKSQPAKPAALSIYSIKIRAPHLKKRSITKKKPA